MRWRIFALLFASALANGCSGDDDEHEQTVGMTPEQLCAKKCELSVAAGCPRTPANYRESCQALCLAKYSNAPSCTDAMRPLDVCSIEKVNYGCDTSGNIAATPQGACAMEGQRCAACTGDFLQCL
jgi:hypothetical protein